MTLTEAFSVIVAHKTPIMLAIYAAPWVAWLLCLMIPGRKEERLLLSANMAAALICLLAWAGYVAYAMSTGGWQSIVKNTDVLLLAAPPYYIIASIMLSRLRMDLAKIPAYRTLQGLAALAVVFVILSWLLNRVRIVLFSQFPISYLFIFVAALLLFGYWGLRRMSR